MRPVYSEKSRNGYGLFSFTETQTHKLSENDEYVEPTRRIGYYWSGAYDEAGMKYYTSSKANSGSNSGGGRGQSQSLSLPPGVGVGVGVDSQSASLQGSAAAAGDSILTPNSLDISKNRTANAGGMQQSCHLLTAARRLADMSSVVPSTKKGEESANISHSTTILQRQSLECTVLRSILLSSPSASLPFSQVLRMLQTARFNSAQEDFCCKTLDENSTRAAIRRLEVQGEAEVTYSSKGEIHIKLLDTKESVAIVNGKEQKGIPLKLRLKNAAK